MTFGRNVMIDEMFQLKKEIRVTQMEARRMAEEIAQRMNVMDSRLQAGESNLRTLDKRETTNANAGQQGMIDYEMKMRETAAEMARFKRLVESEMRGIIEGVKSELRQRESIIQQLDTTCRGLTLQVSAMEEVRASADRDMMTAVERRCDKISEENSRNEQLSIERGLALERVLQREADERATEDTQIRQTLDDALQAMKSANITEASQRVLIHKELRAQVSETASSLHEQINYVREEADRGRQHLGDLVSDEKVQRETAVGMCQRKVDSFVRLYEVERSRLDKSVKDALAQILERTRSVQDLSKRMQDEGLELRRMAARVQDESSVAVRILSETVEDSLRNLTAVQERHTQQILRLKDVQNVDTLETRDRLQQALSKVQGEIEKNFRDDRQAREEHAQRMHEWSEQIKQLEKSYGGKITLLEQTVMREVELARRDIEVTKHKSQVSFCHSLLFS